MKQVIIPLKIGESIVVAGVVEQQISGIWVIEPDITAWTISAKLRENDASGADVGDLTFENPTIDTYRGTFDTSALPAGRYALDVKFQPPDGVFITNTFLYDLTEAVTRT